MSTGTRMVALLLAVYFAVAAGVAVQRRSEAPHLESPPHDFIADDHVYRDPIECGVASSKSLTTDAGKWPPLCTLDAGWNTPASWGVWAFGNHSSLDIFLADRRPRRLVMRGKAYVHPDGRQQSITVIVNGVTVGEYDVGGRLGNFTSDIPTDVQRVGVNRVELRYGYAISPKAAGKSNDPRDLSVAFSRIAVTGGEQLSAGQLIPTNVYAGHLDHFEIARPGRLVIPLDLPPTAERLQLTIEHSPGLDRTESRLELQLESLDGTLVRVQTLPLDDDRHASGPYRLSGSIGVGAFAGEPCQLILTADPQPLGVAFKIAPPEIAERRMPPIRIPPGARSERRPDLVVITLDAARTDTFSCYGYHRETSPFIDRLAGRSVVFRNAFALAPYTLCSVPTMITGLSFLDHRVVGHDDVLSQDAVTLAEHLLDIGYSTAAFSATPNNSRAKAFDQGYEVFVETWKDVSQRDSISPSYLTDRVLEYLDSIHDERPLHLQVHYVPPHGPYNPAPRFDAFTDPGYGGPCDGFFRTVAAIDGGSMTPDQACLDHIKALYDGNLRAVDHEVERILGALRQRPQWQNTAVLITSDHGEAFYEHGRMLHNSQLFDEMLAVPFILKLPQGVESSDVDRGRLVTLADIVPTFLGLAGLEPAMSLEGVDLMAVDSAPRGRSFIARNDAFRPLLGLRSLRWKALLHTSGNGALFDVEQDPGERTNLVFDEPAFFVGLARRIAERISEPPRLLESDDRSEISDTDRDMLHALGYVE